MTLDEWDALALDADCPLADFRERFHIPCRDGEELVYLCGNSLGLMPKRAANAIDEEQNAWRQLAVEAHFTGDRPWWRAEHFLREDLALLCGARPAEVAAMNSLTVNLHLLLLSFYRPTRERYAILIEKGAFPSDRYAVVSQLRLNGFEPKQALIEVPPDEPGGTFSTSHLLHEIERHGERLALILLPGVQYLTGEVLPIAEIARLARRIDCPFGVDLAHAIGNVPLALHRDGIDFAVWCSYKYLNGGPGAIAGLFVHERHHGRVPPRLWGWWGHRPEDRFAMPHEFAAAEGADAWALSNPPVLALAPLRASLAIFREAGMERLRAKSLALTGRLRQALADRFGEALEILTPADPQRHAAQLSLRVRTSRSDGEGLFETLGRRGIVCDWREPDVIRLALAPLYNRHMDAFRLLRALEDWRRAH